jgi:hypothetical protein
MAVAHVELMSATMTVDFGRGFTVMQVSTKELLRVRMPDVSLVEQADKARVEASSRAAQERDTR